MATYFKSRDFPIHLLAMWWLFWLAISLSELNEFIPPSGETLAQYVLLVAAFLFGHAAVKLHRRPARAAARTQTAAFRVGAIRMQWALRLSALGCAAMLLAALRLAGAFETDFVEYFAKLRLSEDGAEGLTGNRALDVLTKILAFPLSYTVIVVVLANDVKHFKLVVVLCVVNLLAFSYLWQVNYPLIHLFWFLVFYLIIQAQRRRVFDKRTIGVMLAVCSVLLASAVNRFGGDVIGGLQRYVVGYHLVGFSFYDHQYRDPNSILHKHSYGRSSLGFLDQVLEAAGKSVDAGYRAASFENSEHNNEAVDIGRQEAKEFNAFGTLLFSLYRDFHIAGILAGGFAYGALATLALYKGGRNWKYGALFIILASSWMMGMMVNPLEQAYFWFAIVALGAFGLVDRGVRL